MHEWPLQFHCMANANENWVQKVKTDGSHEDEWGIYCKHCGYYCDNVGAPLEGKTKQEILNFPFPDPTERSTFRGLREKARQIHGTTGYALMAGQAASLYRDSTGCRAKGKWRRFGCSGKPLKVEMAMFNFRRQFCYGET
jgi:hypothetical protein